MNPRLYTETSCVVEKSKCLNGTFSHFAATLKKSAILKTFILTIAFLLLNNSQVRADQTFAAGAFIVNMGVTPQTVGNGLKPYGLLYDLINNYNVIIAWSVKSGKGKDGIDFTYNGIDYKGGPFIIPVEYRSAAVNARITFWQTQGVVGVTTTSAITVPSGPVTLQAVPRWTLDEQNGGLAVPYFAYAGIPPSAHGGTSSNDWKLPSELTCCDDLFIMPHADPEWSTHQRLFTWNDECNGALWNGCHATSALENMFNPAIPSQQTNFLAEKTGIASGSGPYFENALLLWGNHDDGTLPYSYDLHDDPVMQFMGIIDGATQNGSEQIYIPLLPGWRPTTKIGVWDPDNIEVASPAAKNRAIILAYGRGFGDTERGFIMYEASHSVGKGTAPANIAGMRAFFNYGFYASNEKARIPDISGIPSVVTTGVPVTLSYTITGGSGNDVSLWTSTCGGTFSPNNTLTSNPTTFTPPVVSSPTACVIGVVVTDQCGRKTIASKPVLVNSCTLVFTNTTTNVSCNGGSNGAINMSITGGTGPFSWTWTRVSPVATASGTGTSITGLIAGTYNVNVTNSAGCSGSFTQLITQPNLLTVSNAVSNYLCFGQTGAINLTVNGGTPPYSYSWSNLPGAPDPKDQTGLTAGTYSVTVTDANLCTATTSGTITGPLTNITPSATQINVACNGGNTGSIDLSVTGGTPIPVTEYTYLWSNTATTQDISGLTIGNYSVTITDLNGCTATLTRTITQAGTLNLSTSFTNATCPTIADGAIDLTVTGGTAPYTYNWADLPGPGEPQDRSALLPGTYSVIVTDSGGCTATTSVTIIALQDVPNIPSSINH